METPAKLIMQNVIDALRELLDRFPDEHIMAVETGTIRSAHEKHESTRHISLTLGDRGSLISVDKSRKALRISRAICENAANVTWVRAKSLTYFAKLGSERFHFVLLDSVNDKGVIFAEFRLIIPFVREDGTLIVDDAGISVDGMEIDRGVRAQKGHEVWRFAKAHDIAHEVLETPHGHGTQIKLPLTAENLDRIKQGLARSVPQTRAFGFRLRP